MNRSVVLFCLGLAACAGEQASVAPSLPPAPAPAPAASSTPATAAAPISVPASPEAAYRMLLGKLVGVDTSHGNETRLLEPIAALYRDAGVAVQILESSAGRGNLIARLKGSGKKRPLLLLAHVDVVPVEGQPWTVPPFTVTEKDGFLWGRGINDDKSMASAIVAVTLELARTRAPLDRDVIVALTAGEETGGAAGARWLADHHPELLDAEIALNEGGGMLVKDDFSAPVFESVQVSEKIFQSYRLVAKGPGGHSSRPPTSGDPVLALARALVKVAEHRFAPKVLPETKASFEAEATVAAPEFAAALKRAAASAPRIAPADEAVLAKDAGFNAELRTTCVTTMLKGSPQDNVLPTTAEATINCRILPGETRSGTEAELAKVIGDPSLSIAAASDFGDAPATPFDGEVVDVVKKVTAAMFPGTPVNPGMSTGGTDSRWLRKIGIRAYGVSPNIATRAEAKTAHLAHGPDERKNVKWLEPGFRYFREIVRGLAL